MSRGAEPDSLVSEVRSFNRFYTKQIGLLEEGLLQSPYSLTEVRVLYELAHRDSCLASELAVELSLDPGYLSRILRKFQDQKLIERKQSKEDGRQNVLTLAAKGRAVFEPLNQASAKEVAAMLERLSLPERHRLVSSMKAIQSMLEPKPDSEPFLLRPHRPGDMGWVVKRHGELYSQEYGWDERFEALVAEIAAEFIKNFDQKCERCWIAERHGEPIGSVFLVRKDDEVAKLRLLLVEPSARGFGLGRRLVEECIRFAKQVGYKRITLWTQSNLAAARAIYEKCGFQLMSQQNHRSFGKELVAETWEKGL